MAALELNINQLILPETGWGQVALVTARRQALTPAEVASPLAKRPYDLRHAAVSRWLNAGVPSTQVAEWAGHSVRVLLAVYAKGIVGEELRAPADRCLLRRRAVGRQGVERCGPAGWTNIHRP